jgi:hypothetical protein
VPLAALLPIGELDLEALALGDNPRRTAVVPGRLSLAQELVDNASQP